MIKELRHNQKIKTQHNKQHTSVRFPVESEPIQNRYKEIREECLKIKLFTMGLHQKKRLKITELVSQFTLFV